MEDWEKTYIAANLPQLLELTQCNERFLSILRASNILSMEEYQDINANQTQITKASFLYSIVHTKVSGYGSTALACQQTGQTGAYQILLTGFLDQDPRSILLTAFQNSSQKGIVDRLSSDALKQAIELHQAEYFELFCFQATNEQHNTLFQNIIPSKSPYYIDRLISNRVNLNPDIFKQTCADIFVFKNIQPYELTRLAEGAKEFTAPSGSQIDKLTRRFILLECDEDFYEICTLADNKPVHLVMVETDIDIWYDHDYDNSDNQCLTSYVVEQSTGGSSILWEFAISKDNERRLFLSEHNFLEKLDEDFDQQSRGFCICDSPGMGKSWVLQSIARKLREMHPECLTLFFTFAKLNGVNQDDTCALNTLLDMVCPSVLTKQMILDSIRYGSLILNLFLDGFDEVEHSKLDEATKFIKQILNSSPNIRVFVASRPHLRRTLEKLLKVIAYDIKPFDREDQINCLRTCWISQLSKDKGKQAKQFQNMNLITERLHKFAEICQKKIQENKLQQNNDILGIPLHCHMFAEVNFAKARRYALLNGQASDNIDVAFNVGNMYKEFINEKLPISKKSVKSFHVWKALAVFSDKLANLYKNTFYRNADYSEEKVLKIGLLENRFEGFDKPKLNFVHQTFAEYLVAEQICEIFHQKSLNPNVSKLAVALVKFLINNVYTFQHSIETELDFRMSFWPPAQAKQEPIPLLKREKCLNTVIPFYLNVHMQTYFSQPVCSGIIPVICDSIFPYKLFKILLTCAKFGHCEVLQFFRKVLQSPNAEPQVTKIYLPFLRSELLVRNETGQATFWSSFILFSLATCYADVDFLKECVDFYRTIVGEDVFETLRRVPPWIKTPLHFALLRGDYQIVEYFITNNVSLDGRCYLYHCIADSYNKSMPSVQKRIDICNLLMNIDDLLLKEPATNGNFTLENPLALPNISLELYKFLARNFPKRIHSHVMELAVFPTPMFGYRSQFTAIESVARCMEEDDLHELCRFLIYDMQLSDLFQEEPGCVYPLAYILWYCPSVKLETLTMILNILKKNELAQWFPNILVCASTRTTNVHKLLIEHGARLDVILDGDQNILHYAAYHGNLSLVKFLLVKGVPVNHRNVHGASPMDEAWQHPAVVKMFLKHGGKLSWDYTLDHQLIRRLSVAGYANTEFKTEFNDLITYFASLPEAVPFLMGEISLQSRDSHIHPLVYLMTCSYLSFDNIKVLWETCNLEKHNMVEEHVMQQAVKHYEETKVIKFFISKGLNYQIKDNDKNTILHLAVKQGKRDLVEYIIDTLRVPVNETNRDVNTPLHLAQSWELGKLLMKSGANPLLENKQGKTFAHVAAGWSNESQFKELLEMLQKRLGLSLDQVIITCVNGKHETLLHVRIQKGDLISCLDSFTEGLIKEKWNIIHSLKDNQGNSILCGLARKRSCWSTVNVLLKTWQVKDIDILSKVLRNAVSSESFETVSILHSISETFVKPGILYARSVKMGCFLRGLGADLEATDLNDDTVLHKVKSLDPDSFLEWVYFLKYKCKLERLLIRKNKANQTALHARIHDSCIYMTPAYIIDEFLSVPDYDINSRDRENCTVLMTAILKWPFVGLPGIQCILKHGANKEAHDNENLLHLAVKSKHIEAVNFCLTLGMQPNSREQFMFTPIDLALNLLRYNSESVALCNILEILIKKTFENGAQYITQKCVDGNTILHQAATYGRPEDFHKILMEVLTKGYFGNCFIENKYNKTPLQLAVTHMKILDDTLQVLRENGIEPL